MASHDCKNGGNLVFNQSIIDAVCADVTHEKIWLCRICLENWHTRPDPYVKYKLVRGQTGRRYNNGSD